MNASDYPKSKDADICLILEGTYPFVPGGVANWVHELIQVFPEYRFAAIFLGTKAEDYGAPVYPLPKNLVHLEMHYLFKTHDKPVSTHKNIDKKTAQKIETMHDKFVDFITNSSDCMPELFDLMEENSKLNKDLFLRSKSAWQFIVKKYSEQYANESFFEYFWTIRNLHRPFWELKKIVNHVPKFKILHSASTGYAGFLGALLQKKYAIPHVLTEHGIYTKERWIELVRHSFFKQVNKKSMTFEHEDPLLVVWTRFFSTLAKVAYATADPIISLTEEYRQRQISDGALPDKTRIISYGIDFEHYPFIDKKLNAKTPRIACIGRVVPIKDIKTFIRASALIIKKIPSAEAWIIGSIQEDPEYVLACKSLIASLGLEHKIKLRGIQNMMDIYSKLDLLILTSISEGSPFAMLESLAVGIPIVATNVGGCGELIYGKNEEDRLQGAAGHLVQIGDPPSVAEAAIELITHESSWIKAQKIGLARVRKYYSMDKLVENYGLIYKQAMAYGRHRV